MDGITRRGALATAAALGLSAGAAWAQSDAVERWGLFEIELEATTEGNPFDAPLTGVFTNGAVTVRVPGFHDGQDTWRIRFSPPETGEWRWSTESSLAD